MSMYVMLPGIEASDGNAIGAAARNEIEMGNTWDSATECLSSWTDVPGKEGMNGVMAEVDGNGKVLSVIRVDEAAMESELLDMKDQELAEEIIRLAFWDVDEKPETSYAWEAARRAGLYGQLEKAFDGGEGEPNEIEPILIEAASKLGADIGEGEKKFYWYAFQYDADDNDCGTGTMSYAAAVNWLRKHVEDGILEGDDPEHVLEARIAVVSCDSDYCHDEIKYDDLPYEPIVRYALLECDSPLYAKGLARVEGFGKRDYLVFDDMAHEVGLYKTEKDALSILSEKDTSIDEIPDFENSRILVKATQYQVEQRTYDTDGEWNPDATVAATRMPAGMDLYLKNLISKGDMERNQAVLRSMEECGREAWTFIMDDEGKAHYVREILVEDPYGKSYGSAVLDHVMPQLSQYMSPWLKWDEGEDMIYFPPEGELKPHGSVRIGAEEWREYLRSSPECICRKDGAVEFGSAVDLYGIIDFDRGTAVAHGKVYQADGSLTPMTKGLCSKPHVMDGGLTQ